MRLKSVTAILMMFCSINISLAQRSFVHPGSILTMNDLKRIKQHVDARDEPWYSSWLKLKSSAYGNCTRVANPATDIGGSDGTRQRASGDATAALIDAIEWHVTGQKSYADHAVKLLSAWGNKVESANNQLFQFPSVTMSMAAEMLRYEDGSFYEGWAESDRTNFLNMVRNILYPACKQQALYNTMSSWSAPAMMAVLGAGLLLDDEEIYEEGLSYFRSQTVPGSVYCSLLDNGQLKEMGRDNVHAMLTLNALAQMAQLAWCQGDDLWGEDNNRLLRGFEYWCTYNLGHEDLYYEPEFASDGSSAWYYISTHNNGFRLTPDGRCYECVYHHYKEVKGLDMSNLFPSVTAYAYLTRPEGEPDFGTLFYTIDAANSPLVSEVPAPAEELKAKGGLGSVWLEWKDTRRDDASGFRILRSNDGENFTVIADLNNYTRKSYRDETVEAGHKYYYKVVLYNKAGSAEASDVVQTYVPEAGGLPNGWKTASIGNGWTTGYYTNSLANSFIVKGGGNGFRRSDEGHGFVYRKLRGNGSLTVRLVSTKETFNAVGIMLRSSLTSGSQQVGITLGGTGLRYCTTVSRTSAGSQTNWKTGCDFTYAPVWMRITRDGRNVYTYQSRDGENWHLIQQLTLTLPTTTYIGMLVCAGEDYSACYDNVTFEATSTQAADSTTPVNLTATCIPVSTAHLLWNGIYGAQKYIVYRDGVAIGETETNNFDDKDLEEGNYSYCVSAVVDGVESEKSEMASVDIIRIEKLTGTVIGTTGSWNNNSSTTRSAVFDGLMDTYFDAAQADGAWAGIDLGEGCQGRVTEIRYCPRQSHPQRMNGGRFQVANKSTFSDAVTIHTVSGTPATSTFTSVAIDIPDYYRYLRYISPSNSFCNVAEVEFYGRVNKTSTGVDVIPSTPHGNKDNVYDLQGRRIQPSQIKRGIYIRNGRKWIVN